ncbi:MAG: tRNA (adenosine(37)-N6)-dimethylallyltransferase MiaA [Desulfomonilaceae bacterium]
MQDDPRPRVIVIAGPTAAGKSAAGIELALAIGGEIVSADSMQVYRYMDIGTAKPTPEERRAVPHHMLDIREPDAYYSAGDYVREARAVARNIIERGRIPLVVGGTGLYIRLLLGGVVDNAPRDQELRERLKSQEERLGPGALYKRLQEVDPDFAQRVPRGNLARICRALEVYELTGRPFSQIQAEHAFRDRPYRTLFICLSQAREALYRRIDRRVDEMIAAGLMDEVQWLIKRGYDLGLKPMQSIGYRHMGWALTGRMSLQEATERLKQDTRRYAKRQLTWFRSEPGVLWCDPTHKDRIRRMVVDFLASD